MGDNRSHDSLLAKFIETVRQIFGLFMFDKTFEREANDMFLAKLVVTARETFIQARRAVKFDKTFKRGANETILANSQRHLEK